MYIQSPIYGGFTIFQVDKEKMEDPPDFDLVYICASDPGHLDLLLGALAKPELYVVCRPGAGYPYLLALMCPAVLMLYVMEVLGRSVTYLDTAAEARRNVEALGADYVEAMAQVRSTLIAATPEGCYIAPQGDQTGLPDTYRSVEIPVEERKNWVYGDGRPVWPESVEDADRADDEPNQP